MGLSGGAAEVDGCEWPANPACGRLDDPVFVWLDGRAFVWPEKPGFVDAGGRCCWAEGVDVPELIVSAGVCWLRGKKESKLSVDDCEGWLWVSSGSIGSGSREKLQSPLGWEIPCCPCDQSFVSVSMVGVPKR